MSGRIRRLWLHRADGGETCIWARYEAEGAIPETMPDYKPGPGETLRYEGQSLGDRFDVAESTAPDSAIYQPEVRPEDVEKPAWFLEWMIGTYNYDIQELANRQAASKAGAVETLKRHRLMLDDFQKQINQRKLTKKAKAAKATEHECTRECGRDCDF